MQLLSITQTSQKVRTQWTTFCFKNKTWHVAGKWHKYKKRKKCLARYGNKDSSGDIFHIRFNHSQRNTKKISKRKVLARCLVNLSENIPTATERMTRKFSLYLLYWECQTIYSNSYLKLHNTHLLHLFVDMYILKFFLKK